MSTHRFSFRLESPDFAADRLALRAFEGREAIGQLFRFDIEGVIADRSGLDPKSMIGARASLVLEEDHFGPDRLDRLGRAGRPRGQDERRSQEDASHGRPVAQPRSGDQAPAGDMLDLGR